LLGGGNQAQPNASASASANATLLAGDPSKVKSLPILVYTEKVAPGDLKSYMECGMDGCLSRPFDADALLTTVRQAAPSHLQPLGVDLAQLEAGAATLAKNGRRSFKNRTFNLNSVPKIDSSADLVAKTLAMSASFTNAEGCVNGVLQFDADTMFPYTVLDSSLDSAGRKGAKTGGGLGVDGKKDSRPFFNLVVVHDIFDTCEKMKIFLRPIAQRYPGLQILLWNYPGQAFTEHREEQLLNNEYHAGCLDELLKHVGPDGTNQFNTNNPFYLLGYGNGGNIASFYSAFYGNPSIRSLVLMNSFSYVDPHLASVLHDCMNVFSCSPPNRPDLPIYFFGERSKAKQSEAKRSEAKPASFEEDEHTRYESHKMSTDRHNGTTKTNIYIFPLNSYSLHSFCSFSQLKMHPPRFARCTARFLFSPTYLSSVSTPLALNLYTAVHNPITLKSRIQLW